MKSSAKNIQITSFDDLFSAGNVEQACGEKVQEIDLAELFPFKVLDDENMQDMAESVREHGVLVPGIARPRAGADMSWLQGTAGNTRRSWQETRQCR